MVRTARCEPFGAKVFLLDVERVFAAVYIVNIRNNEREKIPYFKRLSEILEMNCDKCVKVGRRSPKIVLSP